MRILGLDIGSRTVDAVWLEGGHVVERAVTDSGYDPISAARTILDRRPFDSMVATGYGRRLAAETFDCPVVTEIRAYALGAHYLRPDMTGVLDIGGQDTKVIALGDGGLVTDFEMNDKCAAGTGKFLEVMASALGFTLAEFSAAALAAESSVAISSMCTVFAESEATGLVHRGQDRGAIARGLHESIARRTLASLGRVGVSGRLLFAGGVAKNDAMASEIAAGFEGDVVVPDEPQLVGALGAALSAAAGD